MAVAKRVFLFLVVNFFVFATVSVLLSVFNVQPYLTKYGLNYQQLAVFCLLWGFAGAFISLLLSRIMAKWMMGVRVIDPATRDPQLADLVRTVHRLSQKASLTVMPEVGIYDSPELNAFATGPTRSRSLVAVSSGLLRRMTKEQIEGVLAHEIAHVSNGDMVTMTLLQGVINAFVMFLARILAFGVARLFSTKDDSEEVSPFVYQGTVIVLEICFMILGSLIVAAFSRYREFRADKGGAELAGKTSMIDALTALKANVGLVDESQQQQAVQALKISGNGGFMKLFASHPPLDERIKRLQAAR